MSSNDIIDRLPEVSGEPSVCPWLSPPENMMLESNEVHVWRAALDQPARWMQKLAHILSDDEQTRAERFHFERDRRHFIVARGLLRTILGRYLGSEPGQLQFRYGPQGKPFLVESSDAGPLRFNLAHSHKLALYAITYDREIGIDLEHIRPMPDADQIAERFFSAQENRVFRSLPQREKVKAFFNCWTRKEAYIKARGEGLSLPLDRFDVSLIPGEPATLLSVRGEPQEVSRWRLQALLPASDYVAALAVEGHEWRPLCWQWPG